MRRRAHVGTWSCSARSNWPSGSHQRMMFGPSANRTRVSRYCSAALRLHSKHAVTTVSRTLMLTPSGHETRILGPGSWLISLPIDNRNSCFDRWCIVIDGNYIGVYRTQLGRRLVVIGTVFLKVYQKWVKAIRNQCFQLLDLWFVTFYCT